MDNNQPTQPTTPTSQPSQEAPETFPQQPAPAAPQPNLTAVQEAQNQEGSKMIWWLVGGLIVIALLVGGIYWFLSKQQTNQQAIQPPVKQVETQVTTDSLDQDLSVVDVESSGSSDFNEVDQDLQGL